MREKLNTVEPCYMQDPKKLNFFYYTISGQNVFNLIRICVTNNMITTIKKVNS